ncbi:MAG TPA: hypothetical protein VFB02_16615 [Bradyrhizobium sp.]|nr:hypothetical protein [Bradyrhizobium sp.]
MYVLIKLHDDDEPDVHLYSNLMQAKQNAWETARDFMYDPEHEREWQDCYAFRCEPDGPSERLNFFDLATDNDEYRAMEAN